MPAHRSSHRAGGMLVTPPVVISDARVNRCADEPIAGVTFETSAAHFHLLLSTLSIL